MRQRAPRILYFDIESAGVVVVFGYKFSNEPSAKVLLLGKKSLKAFNNKELLVRASKLIIGADILNALKADLGLVGHFAVGRWHTLRTQGN